MSSNVPHTKVASLVYRCDLETQFQDVRVDLPGKPAGGRRPGKALPWKDESHEGAEDQDDGEDDAEDVTQALHLIEAEASSRNPECRLGQSNVQRGLGTCDTDCHLAHVSPWRPGFVTF